MILLFRPLREGVVGGWGSRAPFFQEAPGYLATALLSSPMLESIPESRAEERETLWASLVFTHFTIISARLVSNTNSLSNHYFCVTNTQIITEVLG